MSCRSTVACRSRGISGSIRPVSVVTGLRLYTLRCCSVRCPPDDLSVSVFSAAQQDLFQSVAQVVGINGRREISTDERLVEQRFGCREPCLLPLGTSIKPPRSLRTRNSSHSRRPAPAAQCDGGPLRLLVATGCNSLRRALEWLRRQPELASRFGHRSCLTASRLEAQTDAR